jgi:hypothetical protein
LRRGCCSPSSLRRVHIPATDDSFRDCVEETGPWPTIRKTTSDVSTNCSWIQNKLSWLLRQSRLAIQQYLGAELVVDGIGCGAVRSHVGQANRLRRQHADHLARDEPGDELPGKRRECRPMLRCGRLPYRVGFVKPGCPRECNDFGGMSVLHRIHRLGVAILDRAGSPHLAVKKPAIGSKGRKHADFVKANYLLPKGTGTGENPTVLIGKQYPESASRRTRRCLRPGRQPV